MSYVDPETGEILDGQALDGDDPARVLEIQQLALLKLRDDVNNLATELADTITWLRGRLGESEDGAEAGGQWCWRDMPPERAGELWRELAEWVGWLRGRYPVAGAVPACWWRHPELLEELTALYRAWLGAVAGGTAGTYNAIEWHDRWLPGVLARVKSWGLDRCAHQRQHYERPVGAYDGRAVDDVDAYKAMCHEDVVQRRRTAADTTERQIAMVSAQVMAERLAAGDARSLGGLPGSPVLDGDAFWRPTDNGYLRITDPALVTRLRSDAERLAAAEQVGSDAHDGRSEQQ